MMKNVDLPTFCNVAGAVAAVDAVLADCIDKASSLLRSGVIDEGTFHEIVAAKENIDSANNDLYLLAEKLSND